MRPGPLAATKTNFALIFAVDGTLVPFMSVYLARERGFNPSQIGVTLAIGSIAMVVTSPVVMMLTRGRARGEQILTVTSALATGFLLAFTFSRGFWWILFLFAAFSLAMEPGKLLLDGVFFTVRGLHPEFATIGYNQVRVWGTVGFLVPGILLYFVVRWSGSLTFLPVVALVFAVAALIYSRYLPSTAHPPTGEPHVTQSPRVSRRPARDVLTSGRIPYFLAAMFLLSVATAAYTAFYPLEATEGVGIPAEWLGLLMSLAVSLEVLYIRAFPWLLRTLGWRWLMVTGAGAAMLRATVLAAVPAVVSIIATQLVHGMIIVVTMVGSRMLLDHYAHGGLRYVVQGVYTMVVVGGGRIAGSALGGLVAVHSMPALFWSSAGVCALAAVLLGWALPQRIDVPAIDEAKTRVS
jgi:PPP family 3-phenylpropionic acid transporter